MKEFLKFLLDYWQVIAALILFLAGLLLNLFKRNKLIDSAYALTLEQLPLYVSVAESLFGAGNGAKKASWVLSMARSFYASNGGLNDISVQIGEAIEKILSTPEKKG